MDFTLSTALILTEVGNFSSNKIWNELVSAILQIFQLVKFRKSVFEYFSSFTWHMSSVYLTPCISVY